MKAILLLIIIMTGCGKSATLDVITLDQFRLKYQNSEPVNIAIIGDSTTAGFGANGGPKKWVNGLSYGCVNQPFHGPNWAKSSRLYLSTVGFPTDAQQKNLGIPSAVRLLRSKVESINSNSIVSNYGGPGWIARTHISNNTIGLLKTKPDVIFFNLGINSAKNNKSQDSDLRVLVSQAIASGILPVMVKPNNIGVSNSPSGGFDVNSCPDTWHLMDNWQGVRDNIEKIAIDNNLSVIDLGQDNSLGDVRLLYDSFHPSDLGYLKIFEIYNNFLEKR